MLPGHIATKGVNMSSNELKKDIKRAAKKVLPDPAIRKIRAYRKTRK